MIKKIMSLMLVCVISVFIFGSTVSAVQITTYSLYTYSTSSKLMASQTTAVCTSTAIGYSGETTKIVFNQTLQKKTSSGSWNNVDGWSKTVYSYKGSVSNTKQGISSGTYRLKTVFKVYAGSSFEEMTKYSTEETI